MSAMLSRSRSVAAAAGLLVFLSTASLDAIAQQTRQRLTRVGDIAFHLPYDEARSSADAFDGMPYTTRDKRMLKTLTQGKVAMFGAPFNLTYVFGKDDKLTRVFGSFANAIEMDRKSCLLHGGNLFAASVRQYGSPDSDRGEQDGRE